MNRMKIWSKRLGLVLLGFILGALSPDRVGQWWDGSPTHLIKSERLHCDLSINHSNSRLREGTMLLATGFIDELDAALEKPDIQAFADLEELGVVLRNHVKSSLEKEHRKNRLIPESPQRN